MTVLRQAVGASPTYALGWFNLDVTESRLSPSHLLASQGAVAAAYSLDPALTDRRPDMTIDATVYRTALDLSKPLPPRWSYSQLRRPTLLPIGPLDGAHVGKGGIAAAAGVAGGALLVSLGLI